MSGNEGGFSRGRESVRFGFDAGRNEIAGYIHPESELKQGVMREITFEEAQDARLPSFVQLSPRTGMCFAPSGRHIARQALGGIQVVELFEGRLVSFVSLPFVAHRKMRLLQESTWESAEEMDRKLGELKVKKSTLTIRDEKGDKRILYAGSLNGNYARDGRLEDPEDSTYDFGVIGVDIDPSRNMKDGSGLLSVAHELSHASILLRSEDRRYVDAVYHADSRRLLRPRQQLGYYAADFKNNGFWNFSSFQVENNLYDIRGFYQLLGDKNFDREFRLYHERHAWSDGLGFLWHHPELRQEVSAMGLKKVFAYIERCLNSYRKGYEDNRFTHGRRVVDNPRSHIN